MFWAQLGHLKRPVSPVVFQLGNYVVNSLRCGIYDPLGRFHLSQTALPYLRHCNDGRLVIGFFFQCSLIKAKRLTTIAMVSR